MRFGKSGWRETEELEAGGSGFDVEASKGGDAGKRCRRPIDVLRLNWNADTGDWGRVYLRRGVRKCRDRLFDVT